MTDPARVRVEGRSQAVGDTLGVHKTGRCIVEESQLVWAEIRDGTTGSSGGSSGPGIDHRIRILAGTRAIPAIPVPVFPE